MPRKQGRDVPEGNGPVPHQDNFGPDQLTMADLYRIIKNDSTGWRAILINKMESRTNLWG